MPFTGHNSKVNPGFAFKYLTRVEEKSIEAFYNMALITDVKIFMVWASGCLWFTKSGCDETKFFRFVPFQNFLTS
jgi:hypothetical protein